MTISDKTVQKQLFNVNDYHLLAQTLIFKEDDRIELIEGEIIDRSPMSTRHAATVKRLTQLFYAQVKNFAFQILVEHILEL